jgi:hypothetical protein
MGKCVLDIPKVSFSPHGQILEDKPETKFTRRVCKPAGVYSIHSNQVPGMVLIWWSRNRHDVRSSRSITVGRPELVRCTAVVGGHVAILMRHAWLAVRAWWLGDRSVA